MEEAEQLMDTDGEVEYTPPPVRESAILRASGDDEMAVDEAVPMHTWEETMAAGSRVEVAMLE
eukprot:3095042-Alexandrium_andersonii.AAC.1